MPQIILLIALFFSVAANAATPANPAYRLAEAQSLAPASSGLRLSFDADENQCRQKYGKRWQDKCAAVLGMPGREEKNISMIPHVPGRWVWQYGNSLVFTPAAGNFMRPGTTYKISLAKLFIPANIKLDKKELALRTIPKTASLNSCEFMIDPAPSANHRLAAAFSFNYPEEGNFQNPRLLINDQVFQGAPEVVWNNEKNQLNISWLVRRLPENPSTARIVFPGYDYMVERQGEIFYQKSAREGAVFSQNLPGGKNLLNIRNVSIKKQPDKNLDQENILEIDSSLYLAPEDSLKHIAIWQLPVHNSPGAVRPYDWSNAPAISAEVLKASRKIHPELLGGSAFPSTRNKFKFTGDAGRYVLVRVDENLASVSGQALGKPWFSILKIPEPAGQLGFLQSGNILPRKGKNKIDIYSANLDKIVWKLEKIREPFLALIAQAANQPFTDYLAPLGLELSSFSVVREGEIVPLKNGEDKAQFSTLALNDLAEADKLAGPMRLTLTGYRGNEEAAYASRLIMPANLSIIIKKSRDGGLDCFVYRLDTGQGAENADVSVLGANGLQIRSLRTDSKGHCRFPSLAGLARENLPVAILAQEENDLAWMPLNDKSRILDYTSFAVSGNHISDADLNVYAFGQRGVYRPGDMLNFGVVSRKGDFSPLPADLPLYAEVLDPAGRRIWHQAFSAGEHGLAELSWQSSATSASGKYNLNIRSSEKGAVLYNCLARIENFMPETMKLKISAPESRGWIIAGKDSQAEFSLQNLYGTPARDSRIKASLSIMPAKFRFAGYEDYNFTDAAPFMGKGQNMELPDCRTDENGEAMIALPLNKFSGASGRAVLLSEGYANGSGKAATAQSSFLFSPMEKIIGIKMLAGLTNPAFITRGEKAAIELIALDSSLNKAEWQNLDWTLLHAKYATSLISDGSGGFRYDDLPVHSPVNSGKLSLGKEALVFELPTSECGDFLFILKDKDRMIGQFPFSVAGTETRMPGTSLAGSKMRLRLDKKDYNAGDVIRCAIDVPYDCHGLLAIERENVKEFKWFEATAGENILSVDVPQDFEGKGYVTAVVMRNAESPAIYMEPSSFAAAPFVANIDRRKLPLEIIAAENAIPGEDLKLTIKTGSSGKFIVSAVDEGILLLDNFIKPDPVNELLANRALDVTTLQTADLIMPDHERIASRISPFGGGMGSSPFGMRFQNPFKRNAEPPVVWWSGIMDAVEQGRDISIQIPPYYNGSLKIMVIALDTDACGVAEKSVKIKAPVVITPNFPAALAPNDQFKANIILENTQDKEITGDFSVVLPDGLKSRDDFPGRIVIPGNETVLIPLKIAALDNPGVYPVKISFFDGKRETIRPVSLSVRPVSQLRRTVSAGMGKGDFTVSAERKVYPFQARRVLALSATPFSLLEAYNDYLETYPHGCTEQLISRAFGQILLDNSGQEVETLVNRVFTILLERGNYDGVALWPGCNPDYLLTAYAVDYLLTLREKGNFSHAGLLNMLCDALENNCDLNEPSLETARQKAYAIWLLSRSGRITTRYLDNLTASMNELGLPWANDITAMLMRASQREMRIQTPLPAEPAYCLSGDWLDEFPQQALYVTLVARYFPENLTEQRKMEFYDAVIANLNSHNYATFSSLMGLRSLASLNDAQEPENLRLKVSCLDGEDNNLEWLDFSAIKGNSCNIFSVENPVGGKAIFWQLREDGYDSQIPDKEEANGIRIEKELLNANGDKIDHLAMGEVATIRVTVVTEDGREKDCVITDLLPGGCEMVFLREDDELLLQNASFMDRQEDRMLLYAKINGNPKKFEWKIRAMNEGIFSLPPSFAEDMLNMANYGSSKAEKISIAETR